MSSPRVIVIGSGPAGAMAARELVRRGVPVTMLEAGQDRPVGFLLRVRGRNLYRRGIDTADGDGYVTTGHPGTKWYVHLGPGGLTNQWTGAVPRFAPTDFTEGEALHERYRWPLDYEDLAPYYRDAERILHVTATGDDVPSLPAGLVTHRRRLPRDWHGIAEVARRRGQGLTVLPLADGPEWLATRRGTAFNSFSTVVERLQRSPRFQLRTGAQALMLEWSGAQRRVTAVVYRDETTGEEHRLDALAVVVAGGALNSTRLLLHSRCPDFPEGLANTDGVLGRYLHDHPKEWWSFESERPLSQLIPAGYLTRRPVDESPPLLATSWTIGATSDRDKLLASTPVRARRFGVQVFGSMIPVEGNFVRLSDATTDRLGQPGLELHIDFDDAELKNMAAAREHFCDLMGEAGVACRIDPVVPQLTPGMAVHYGGTVRMHRDRRYGALNEWNRPFDVPNLVVADASCFTTNSEKNPTLTVMALAARAAHRLADDLRTG